MAANVTIRINSEGGDKVLKNVNDLKSAIADLEKESANMDLGSEAFEKSKNQIDELKKKLQELSKSQTQLDQEMNEAAERSAEQRAQRMEKIGGDIAKFAAGVTDAFAGALIAFGAGEEDAKAFNETLQKGLGIAIGVKGGIEALVAGVELAGPAFEAFNAVLAANPIGVVVAALAALAAGIYLVVKAINAEEKESEKLTKQLEEQKKAALALKAVNDNEIAVMEAKIGLMQAQGKSDAEILKAQKELYEAKRKGLEQDLVQLELQARISQAKLAEELANTTLTESYYELAASIARKTGDDQQANMLELLLANSRKERQKEATDQLVTDLTAVAKLKTDLVTLDINQQAQVAAVQTKNREEYKKTAEEAKKAQEEAYKAYQERFAKELELLMNRTSILDEARQVDIAAEEANEARKAKAKLDGAELTYMYSKKSVDDEIALLEAKRQEEIRVARQTGQDVALINKKYADQEDALREEDKKKRDAKFAEDLQKANGYAQAVGSVLSSIVGVFQAVSDLNAQKRDEELRAFTENTNAQLDALSTAKEAELSQVGLTEEQKATINNKYAQQEYQLRLAQYNKETEVKKKAFEQDKKFKIASTAISILTGSIAALTGMIAAIPGPGGIIAGALAAAAVVATGAVQIAAIKAQKFDAGSPPQAPSLSAPSDTSGSGSDNPNAFGSKGGPNLYGINGDLDENGINKRNKGNSDPIKAYVVTEDMTKSQNLGAVIERRSSF